MSLNNEAIPRNKPFIRDSESQRARMPINDSHILNLAPPPSTALYSSSNVRPSAIPGNFNMAPPPSSSVSTSSMLGDAMSTFNKERLHDVLQQGLGTYVYIENYGLVPKLSHF